MKAEPKPRSRTASVAACAAAIAASVGLAAAPPHPPVLDQVERYCSTSWRHAGIHPQDWADCTQEAIVQLLERVPQERLEAAFQDDESQERRELKRAIWRTVQRWRRAPRFQALHDGQPVDPHYRQEYACESLEEVELALRRLSPRQRRILTLWSQGWSVEEISRRLGISAPQASDGKYKALRKVRAAMSAV